MKQHSTDVRRKRALLTYLQKDVSRISEIRNDGMLFSFEGKRWLLLSKHDNDLLMALTRTFNYPQQTLYSGEVKYRGCDYIVRVHINSELKLSPVKTPEQVSS